MTTFNCQCGCGHRFTFTGIDGAPMLIVHADGRMLGTHLLMGAEARRVAYGILGGPRGRSTAVSIPGDQGQLIADGHVSVRPGAGMTVHPTIPNGTVLRGWLIESDRSVG